MLGKIKLSLIHLLSGVGRIFLKIRGIQTGTGIIFSKLPRVKKFPGSTITIGNGVTIHSSPRMNPVLTHRSCLATLSKQAHIRLDDGCGISGTTLICINNIHIGRDTLIGAGSLIMDNDMHYPLSGTKWGNTGGGTGIW